jgi:hypothetical protein
MLKWLARSFFAGAVLLLLFPASSALGAHGMRPGTRHAGAHSAYIGQANAVGTVIVGLSRSVVVSASNGGGSTRRRRPAPANTGLPSVSGSAVEGQTLSASNGSWSGSPTSFAYQWEDCNSSGSGCVTVSGATASTYKLAAGDVGHTVRVVVNASNGGGSTPASSDPTVTVIAAATVTADPPSAPTNTGLPSVSGSAVEGQTLSASNGSWSGSPTSFAYQWEDCNSSGSGCVTVSGATASTYKLAAGDVGQTVRVVVNASNGGGSTPASSVATATVIAAPAGQTTWRAVGTPPLSSAAAAARVIHRVEQRPGNVAANQYVPSTAELADFYTNATLTGYGPLKAYVDGRPGLPNPSTDDLIQWASIKWGIPTDWLRAQYSKESGWTQSKLGDQATVSPAWWAQYPAAAQLANNEVYETMGITQVKWTPDGVVGAGTEPLRWKSTAFNVDYAASIVRYYYDGYCNWCGAGYSSGQEWASIGAWYEPAPWNGAGVQAYIADVQARLAAKAWLSPSF